MSSIFFDKFFDEFVIIYIIIYPPCNTPIFEIPVEKNSQVPLPGTGNLFKKEQYDIQIYTPGMRMFDYIVSRESEKSAYGSVPINKMSEDVVRNHTMTTHHRGAEDTCLLRFRPRLAHNQKDG